MDFDGRDARGRELPRPAPEPRMPPRVPALAPNAQNLLELPLLPLDEGGAGGGPALLLCGQPVALNVARMMRSSSGPAKGLARSG